MLGGERWELGGGPLVFHLLLTYGFPKWKIDGEAAAETPGAYADAAVAAAVAMADEVPHSFSTKRATRRRRGDTSKERSDGVALGAFSEFAKVCFCMAGSQKKCEIDFFGSPPSKVCSLAQRQMCPQSIQGCI